MITISIYKWMHKNIVPHFKKKDDGKKGRLSSTDLSRELISRYQGIG